MKETAMKKTMYLIGLVLASVYSLYAGATVNLDRTRLVFDGNHSSVSILVANNMNSPYLLQTWVETENEEKILRPLLALPPLQRIEMGEKKIIQVVRVDAEGVPQDQESLFYLNILEVPPKAEAENTLQIAFQSRLKLFYRPKGLINKDGVAWQKKMTLSVDGDVLTFKNPTAFHTVIAFLGDNEDDQYPEFSEVLLKPFATATYRAPRAIGEKIYLSYMDDTGASRPLIYQCEQDQCVLVTLEKEQ